ncbi:restriction endonuclease subunit S [Streptomyces iakyrus]|uniref:restriction endonuclease subunit S n=1 Tax=Streptomyces iakyrus TaxID=68219 RepID=UPI0036E86B97
MSVSGIPPELPVGWAWTTLGEVVEVLDHLRVPVSVQERTKRLGGVPYYGATGKVGWIDEAIFNEDLILLGEDGVQFFDADKPKAYVISGPSWVNNHAHVLRPLTGFIDQRYLTYYLNHFNYEGFANGTTRLKLTKSAMIRIPVALPPLAEQKRIAAALEEQLSRLDVASGTLDVSGRRIERYLKAVLHRMTSAYETVRLQEVLASGLTNGRSVPTRAGGFPVLRLTALSDSNVDLGQYKEGDWGADEAEPFLVRKGDFLISRGNGSLSLVGRGALVVDTPAPIAYPDTMIRVRSDVNKILPEYLHTVWSSLAVRRQIESQARTTAGIYKVNQKILGAIEFPLPNVPTQRALCAQWSETEQQARHLTRTVSVSKRRSATLRRSLLAEAFSGRLAPQDVSDEPADVLAARISAEREASEATKPRRRSPRRAPAQRKRVEDAAPAPNGTPPPRADTPILATQPTLDLEIPS